ncbi:MULTISPECIES: SAM-dependent methyltransferase [Streptomyces]|uniref:SAM-dependent methyltransferase n=1 Tax=Streptomyces TaxID=1883 RepID=UPI0036BE49FA
MPDITADLFGAVAGIHAMDLPRTTVSPPFDGLLGAFYTKLVSTSEADPAWFVQHAGPPEGDVLELCCGGGRTAIAFARTGRRVTAVDLSTLQLAAAEKRAAENGVSELVTWVHADVTGLDLGRTYSTIVIAGLSITLFDGPARDALLAVARRHLSPGGRILFDHTPVRAGEVTAEQTISLPVVLGERRGFVLVAGRRIPEENLQFTNMYAELIDGDGHTRRHLTGFRFRIDTADGLAEQLAGHRLVVKDRHQDPSAWAATGPTPFAARELVVAQSAS